MSRQLLLLLIIVQSFAVISCATMPTYYQAKALSKEEGAEIRGYWESGLFYPSGVEIDKVDALLRSRWVMPISPIIVDPGTRRLSVIGYDSGDIGKVDLQANLQAGGAYIVQFERKEQQMSFWVEDIKTREEVSERQTTVATKIPFSWGGLMGTMGLSFPHF